MLRSAIALVSVSLLFLEPLAAQQGNPPPGQGSSSSSSSSHRVVVVDGKKVVDERAQDGRRVPSGDPAGRCPDLERMMRDMQEQMRQHGFELPAGFGPGGPGQAHASSSSSSSSSQRVVVVDGKKVVDERTVDGKPVPAGTGGQAPDAGGNRQGRSAPAKPTGPTPRLDK